MKNITDLLGSRNAEYYNHALPKIFSFSPPVPLQRNVEFSVVLLSALSALLENFAVSSAKEMTVVQYT